MASPVSYKQQTGIKGVATHAVLVLGFLLALHGIKLVYAKDADDILTVNWNTPSKKDHYRHWVKTHKHSLTDGKKIRFKLHKDCNVAEVSRKEYKDCKANSTAVVLSSGEVDYTLITGKHYYICTIEDHCREGQKLHFQVKSSKLSTSKISSEKQLSAMKSGSSVTIISAAAIVLGAVSAIVAFFFF